MCDVARGWCDVAGDVRQHCLRCRSTPGRHRSRWRGGWPSDVATSCDVRGGRRSSNVMVCLILLNESTSTIIHKLPKNSSGGVQKWLPLSDQGWMVTRLRSSQLRLRRPWVVGRPSSSSTRTKSTCIIAFTMGKNPTMKDLETCFVISLA